MNFKQLRVSNRVNSLAIIQPMIIHAIPEFGKTVADMINGSGLRMNNCWGVVSKAKPQKLGNKVFNSRKIYLNAKAKLTTKDSDSSQPDKMLKVLQSIPEQQIKSIKDQKKFIIVDHTIISQAAQYMFELTNVKNALFFMLQQVKREFLNYKTKNADIQNNIMFLFDENRPEPSMIELLHKLMMSPQGRINDNLKIFDKYILTSLNIKNSPIIFPIANYGNHGNPQIYRKHINLLDDIYSKMDELGEKPLEVDNQDKKETPSKSKELKSTVLNKFKTNLSSDNPAAEIAKDISTNEKVIDKKLNVSDDKISSVSDINQKQLSRILRKYKIRDKMIEDNIRNAIDTYLSENPRNVTSENIEKIILLAINKSIFNKDEIDDEYLENPAKLFAKLHEVNTYSKDITYPKEKQPTAISASDVIDLKRVTGLVRHEYEFSDNIHGNIKTLFKSLESRLDAPIKVKKVDFKYEDNNLNRVINYDITLQNMTGENKEPYKVNVKVPALVNDRYFKLNGKNYIMANQQFFKPITKTDPNEVRLLTSYSTITLSVINMKINISEIDKIIDYININYPELIVKVDQEHNKIIRADLKDKKGNIHNFDLYSNEPYNSDDEQVYLDEDTGKWMFKKEEVEKPLPLGKSEYLYDKLIKIIQTVNPSESLKKSAKSIPYIQAHVSDIKLPLIILMWQQIGLVNALKKYGVAFDIKTGDADGPSRSIELDNGKFIHIYPKTDREKLFVNGILLIDRKKYKFTQDDIKSPNSIDKFIQDKNGTRATYLLNLQFSSTIDPITKELLEYDEMSTNLVDLINDNMVTKLLNDKPDKLTDLKIYRSRQAEVIFNLLYKEIMSAHSKYAKDKQFNKDAKLFLKPEYVIECLLGVHKHNKGNTTLEQAQPYNPVAELKVAAKLIKTGPGGVPTKRSFKKEHRGIHPSYYGNIGANATTEYADVG